MNITLADHIPEEKAHISLIAVRGEGREWMTDMIKWEELMENRAFITDLGKSQNAVVQEQEMTIGRYAVWSPLTNSKNHQVIEVGENLEYLRKKYHIPEERVCHLAIS